MNCWRTAIRSSRPPIEFHYEDGRKRIFFAGRPDDPPGINDQLVTGIARACRWKELRDNGEFDSPEALAAALSVNGSCVRRFLRRTIMAGKAPRTLARSELDTNLPFSRQEQPKLFAMA